jgi:hypothetical protein
VADTNIEVHLQDLIINLVLLDLEDIMAVDLVQEGNSVKDNSLKVVNLMKVDNMDIMGKTQIKVKTIMDLVGITRSNMRNLNETDVNKLF